MGLKKKLTKENMKGMSAYAKEKLYQKAADKYGIKYESKTVGGRPGQYSAKEAGKGAKYAVNQAMETDPNFAIAKAMGGTEGDKKTISHFADYKKQGKQVNDGEFGGYKANAKVAANAYQRSQDLMKEDILDSLPKTEIRDKNPLTQDKPVELSARAQAAMENPLGEYGFSPEKRGFKGNNNLAYDPNAGVKSDKAGAFLGEYKLDIQEGIGKDGTPGRGPNSIHNKF